MLSGVRYLINFFIVRHHSLTLNLASRDDYIINVQYKPLAKRIASLRCAIRIF